MTNETEPTYYRVTVRNYGEFYEWADTALAAANLVRTEILYDNHRAGKPQPIGPITARPAVYGEWKRSVSDYTNGMFKN